MGKLRCSNCPYGIGDGAWMGGPESFKCSIDGSFARDCGFQTTDCHQELTQEQREYIADTIRKNAAYNEQLLASFELEAIKHVIKNTPKIKEEPEIRCDECPFSDFWGSHSGGTDYYRCKLDKNVSVPDHKSLNYCRASIEALESNSFAKKAFGAIIEQKKKDRLAQEKSEATRIALETEIAANMSDLVLKYGKEKIISVLQKGN